jgi:hypothetical protein
MREYKSNKYKYIKMNAKVGSSKSNTITPNKTGAKKVKRVKSQGCGGCSRRSK